MRFYVYRHGSNAANQHLCQVMCVAEVEAPTATEAEELAEKRVKVYNNQYLEARDADKEDAEEEEVDSRVTVL